MRTPDEHTQNLQALIRCERPLGPIVDAIESVPADIHAPPLAVLTPTDCIAVLDLYLAGRLSRADLVKWSRAVEVRADVEFDSGAVGTAIFRLAHSDSEGTMTESVVRQLQRQLSEPG